MKQKTRLSKLAKFKLTKKFNTPNKQLNSRKYQKGGSNNIPNSNPNTNLFN